MRPIIRIHDTAKDELIDREMNDAEFAQYEIDVANGKARTAAIDQAAADKAALLAKLGITADEAKLLLG
jgi:hypothetical protein